MEDTHYTLSFKRGVDEILVKPDMTYTELKNVQNSGEYPSVEYQCGTLILRLVIGKISPETGPGTFEVIGSQEDANYTVRYVGGVVQSVEPSPEPVEDPDYSAIA